MNLRLLSVLPLLCVLGCSTLRVVQPSLAAVSAEVETGDRIEILISSDQLHELTVISLTEMGIIGENDQGQEMLIGYDEMVGLQVRQFAPGKTAGLAAGIAAVFLAVEFRDFDPLGGN